MSCAREKNNKPIDLKIEVESFDIACTYFSTLRSTRSTFLYCTEKSDIVFVIEQKTFVFIITIWI